MTENHPNRSEPLGLPAGSVRAILALTIVVAFVGLCVWRGDTLSLKDIVLMTISFYFGSKVK